MTTLLQLLVVVSLLVWTQVATAQDILVNKAATWKYLDNGSDQGMVWVQPAFNDRAWSRGPAQLGYGDGDEATVVSYGPDSANKYITTYFRHRFNVTNPAAYASLTLNLLRDDGAVVYLNGLEVYRSNMPAGVITYTTLASTAVAGTDETTFYSTTLSPTALVAGSNVIAVEIHQVSRSSSDISFALELVGNAASASVTRGPYLQMGTASAVTVRWRTNVPTASVVRYGPAPGQLTASTGDNGLITEHELRLTGLSPATLYYYAVGTPTATLAGGDASTYFTTAPATGVAQTTRIWVIGDSGTADSSAAAVYNAYRTFTADTYTNLWLMLGDNAYNDGTDAEYQTAVFDMYPEILRQTVLWPTLGNHDGHTADSATQSGPYYDIFTLPRNADAGGVASGTEAYYAFDYGNIHFVVLDSYETDRSTAGAMMAWLQADLQATSADWLIAFWHHPPYSKGSHDSDTEGNLIDMRQNFLPVLEAYGVDVVLTGHSHAYERSKLIDGHYGPSSTFSSAYVIDGGSGRVDGTGAYTKFSGGVPHDGTVYTVAGNAGRVSGGALNHPVMYLSLNELGSLVLDVHGLTLDAKFLSATGTVRDYFTISKSEVPPPQAVIVDLQQGADGYSGMQDAFVSSSRATTNFGTDTLLRAGGQDRTYGRTISALQWDLSGLPTTATVTAATLGVYVTDASAGLYNVYALTRPWSASTVTWASLDPTASLGTRIGHIPPGGATGWRQIVLNSDGVALVQGWINGTRPNHGIGIVDAATPDDLRLRSSEDNTVTQRPKLTVQYRP